MRDKYGVSQDPYCYPDSDVLKNLLNLRDADALAEAESQFVRLRYMEYVSNVHVLEDFSLEHFLRLHYVLFQDIYSWAGQLRDVDKLRTLGQEQTLMASMETLKVLILSLIKLFITDCKNEHFILYAKPFNQNTRANCLIIIYVEHDARNYKYI